MIDISQDKNESTKVSDSKKKVKRPCNHAKAKEMRKYKTQENWEESICLYEPFCVRKTRLFPKKCIDCSESMKKSLIKEVFAEGQRGKVAASNRFKLCHVGWIVQNELSYTSDMDLSSVICLIDSSESILSTDIYDGRS